LHALPGAPRNPLSALSKWKLFDNLRRSLVPTALIALAVLGWARLPELWPGEGPQCGDEAGGHDRDEDPARDVAAVTRAGDPTRHGGHDCRSGSGVCRDDALHSLSPCVGLR
ncbi:MAG: hypothetical protein JF622_00925, partial [Terrabacter sp.]|nr:hypothetical protein [Terrabacter sp.]